MDKFTCKPFGELFRNIGLNFWTARLHIAEGIFVRKVIGCDLRDMFEDLYLRMTDYHFKSSFRSYKEDLSLTCNLQAGYLYVNETFDYVTVKFIMADGQCVNSVIDSYWSAILISFYQELRHHHEYFCDTVPAFDFNDYLVAEVLEDLN